MYKIIPHYITHLNSDPIVIFCATKNHLLRGFSFWKAIRRRELIFIHQLISAQELVEECRESQLKQTQNVREQQHELTYTQAWGAGKELQKDVKA